jgi:hypothetical protein
MWMWQSVLALVGTWPAIALVRAAYGRHPRGDAPLWDGDALALLALLSREMNGFRAAIGASGVVLLLGAVSGLLPMAALSVSMAHATREGRAIGAARSAEGALRALRPLALLLVVVGVAQCALAAGAVLIGEMVEALGHAWLGEAHAQAVGLTFALLLLLPAVAFGVVHDLARGAVVRFELGAMRALAVGAQTFRGAPISVAWAWAWRGLAGIMPVAIVAAISGRLGGRQGAALLVLAALHQSVILSRVSLHASWLAKAMRTVRPPPPLFEDEFSDSL